MQSQNRAGFTYTFTGSPTNDLSGNGGQRRVTLVCDPNLPASERTFAPATAGMGEEFSPVVQ